MSERQAAVPVCAFHWKEREEHAMTTSRRVDQDELERAIPPEQFDRRQQHERLVERIGLHRVRGEILPGCDVSLQPGRVPHDYELEIAIRHSVRLRMAVLPCSCNRRTD